MRIAKRSPRQPRIIQVDMLLAGADEVILEHAGRQYPLRVTLAGRLVMPDPRRRLRRRWTATAILLAAAYLIGAPVILGVASKRFPTADPILQTVYAPLIPLYEHVEPYMWYCDWSYERTQELF